MIRSHVLNGQISKLVDGVDVGIGGYVLNDRQTRVEVVGS